MGWALYGRTRPQDTCQGAAVDACTRMLAVELQLKNSGDCSQCIYWEACWRAVVGACGVVVNILGWLLGAVADSC